MPVDGFRGSICPTFFRKCQMWVRWATGAKWMPYNCATSIMGAGRCQLSGACQSERAVGTRSSQSRASGCRSRGDGPAYESAMSLHWQMPVPASAPGRPARVADCTPPVAAGPRTPDQRLAAPAPAASNFKLKLHAQYYGDSNVQLAA